MEAATAFFEGIFPGYAIAVMVNFLESWNPPAIAPFSRWKLLTKKLWHRRKLISFWGSLGGYVKQVPRGKLRHIVRVARLDRNLDERWRRMVIRYATLDKLQGVWGMLGGALRRRPHRRLRGPARRAALHRIMARDSL